MDAVDSDADPDGDNHTICFYFYDTEHKIQPVCPWPRVVFYAFLFARKPCFIFQILKNRHTILYKERG